MQETLNAKYHIMEASNLFKDATLLYEDWGFRQTLSLLSLGRLFSGFYKNLTVLELNTRSEGGREPTDKVNDVLALASPGREETRLPGGGPKVGHFWSDCKGKRKCGTPPYDRLLTNRVLKTDYRTQ